MGVRSRTPLANGAPGRTAAIVAMVTMAGALTTMLTSCSAAGSGSSAPGGNPSASGWSIVVPGSRTPSPAFGVGTPGTTVTVKPGTITPITPITAPSGLFTGYCPGRLYPGMMSLLTVVPGTGSATVTWSSAGGASVGSYRVAAVSQDLVFGTQPPLNWVTVPSSTTCTLITATVPGLRSGGRYVFWLDAVVVGTGTEVMIGRSAGFKIL